jgi:predicted TIM-barrel fold metal-dependent hydrolase
MCTYSALRAAFPIRQSADTRRRIERLTGWASDANLLEKILVENPARLYDF